MTKTKKKKAIKRKPAKKRKRRRSATTRAIIVKPADLAPAQKKIIAISTPDQFVKQRQGKGGKTFNYVEVGYVIARLNEAFSPIGWDFSIIKEIIEPKEVVVKGKLIIKDYKSGYEVSKTQYGTKERHAGGVPLGDTLKAAASDCLKKCASMFGIALDVYWPELDRGSKENGENGIAVGKTKTAEPAKPEKSKTIQMKDLYRFTLQRIKDENNEIILRQMIEKMKQADLKLYPKEMKEKLIRVMLSKIGV